MCQSCSHIPEVDRTLNENFSSKKSLKYHIQRNSEGTAWGATAHNFIPSKWELEIKISSYKP